MNSNHVLEIAENSLPVFVNKCADAIVAGWQFDEHNPPSQIGTIFVGVMLRDASIVDGPKPLSRGETLALAREAKRLKAVEAEQRAAAEEAAEAEAVARKQAAAEAQAQADAALKAAADAEAAAKALEAPSEGSATEGATTPAEGTSEGATDGSAASA